MLSTLNDWLTLVVCLVVGLIVYPSLIMWKFGHKSSWRGNEIVTGHSVSLKSNSHISHFGSKKWGSSGSVNALESSLNNNNDASSASSSDSSSKIQRSWSSPNALSGFLQRAASPRTASPQGAVSTSSSSTSTIASTSCFRLASRTKRPHLCRLPEDLLTEVLSYLPVVDVLTTRCLGKAYHKHLQGAVVWRQLEENMLARQQQEQCRCVVCRDSLKQQGNTSPSLSPDPSRAGGARVCILRSRLLNELDGIRFAHPAHRLFYAIARYAPLFLEAEAECTAAQLLIAAAEGVGDDDESEHSALSTPATPAAPAADRVESEVSHTTMDTSCVCPSCTRSCVCLVHHRVMRIGADFVNDHPGGRSILEDVSVTDATAAYGLAFHSEVAVALAVAEHIVWDPDWFLSGDREGWGFRAALGRRKDAGTTGRARRVPSSSSASRADSSSGHSGRLPQNSASVFAAHCRCLNVHKNAALLRRYGRSSETVSRARENSNSNNNNNSTSGCSSCTSGGDKRADSVSLPKELLYLAAVSEPIAIRTTASSCSSGSKGSASSRGEESSVENVGNDNDSDGHSREQSSAVACLWRAAVHALDEVLSRSIRAMLLLVTRGYVKAAGDGALGSKGQQNDTAENSSGSSNSEGMFATYTSLYPAERQLKYAAYSESVLRRNCPLTAAAIATVKTYFNMR